ncbi:phage holin [Macrococcus bovicus]|uniref:Phage holin n=1 Tax=Macrococcus bovicus TaxID=69968 RepID=A0A4R6C2U8_9STAP|nr:phage holin [Macrococcus bovicus]TDM15690.1 phage holin [Macrococcus bovicus]
MKINWAIRFKKKTFLVALFSALLLFANQVAGILGYDISEYSKSADALFTTVLNILVLIGVVDDPTVKGMLTDSDLSMEKVEPTDPNMDLTIKGEQEVTDESQIEVDNTDNFGGAK